MDIHKNARLTPKGREEMVRAVVDGGLTKAAAARTVQHHGEDRRANGSSASARKAWTVCATVPRGLFHRQAKRRRPQCDAVEALRRQRYTGKQIAAEVGVSPATVSRVLHAARAEQAQRAGAGRADPPLRARAPGRADPPRYQEARPDRLCRSPHHRAISWRGQPPSRHRLGVRPRLHRRCLAPRLRRRSCPTSARRAPWPSSRPLSPSSPASASPSSG